jgi:hypothetical protein
MLVVIIIKLRTIEHNIYTIIFILASLWITIRIMSLQMTLIAAVLLLSVCDELRKLHFGRWRQRDRPQLDGFHTRPQAMGGFGRVTLDKKLCI